MIKLKLGLEGEEFLLTALPGAFSSWVEKVENAIYYHGRYGNKAVLSSIGRSLACLIFTKGDNLSPSPLSC